MLLKGYEMIIKTIQIMLFLIILSFVAYSLYGVNYDHIYYSDPPESNDFDVEKYRKSTEFRNKHFVKGDDPPPTAKLNIKETVLQPSQNLNTSEGLIDQINKPEIEYQPPLIKGTQEKTDAVINVLKQIEDPELHIDIYNLGLIREIAITSDGDINFVIIFTSLFCPFSKELVAEIRDKCARLDWCRNVRIKVDVEQQWSRRFLSASGKKQMEKVFGW